ncbi:hypothetical protein [Halostella pelagica]|uniref:hypothetical protein n=1 Tax=Halostella pelagica TaxID=2583824 RepID=UPI00108189B6|nr:hypothetical protein [Halostella pelagica]
MEPHSDYSDSDGGYLSQFEKNRFFKGKLMTPRDMEAEQEYHAERLQTITRLVTGSGILQGLGVQSITETDDGLDVTIEPGFALDGNGRPIVVEQVATKSLPSPSGNEVHLYLRYNEVAMETVPVPDTTEAADESATPNRVVEVFELTYQESPPENTIDVPDVELPRIGDDGVDREALARRAIERFHERHRSASTDDEDPAVFLGSFERNPDGTWGVGDDATARPFVYDAELLFGLLVEHVTDTENPHQTPVDQASDDIPEDIVGISDRLTFLEEEMKEIKRDRAALTRYVMRKTIKDRIRFFEALAERLEDHTGDGSRLAREIVELSHEELQSFDAREESYRRHVRTVLDQLIDLGECLDENTTEDSLEQYLKAVSELQTVVEDGEPVLELADAHDQVCEAADSLEILVGVIPDE